jgi:transposase
MDTVFNAETFVPFLEQLSRFYYPKKIYMLLDNGSYHKKEEVWDFVRGERGRLSLNFFPPYSPELNAIERIWHHVRLHATHNRYFETLDDLKTTLQKTLTSIQAWPTQIQGYLNPFI